MQAPGWRWLHRVHLLHIERWLRCGRLLSPDLVVVVLQPVLEASLDRFLRFAGLRLVEVNLALLLALDEAHQILFALHVQEGALRLQAVVDALEDDVVLEPGQQGLHLEQLDVLFRCWRRRRHRRELRLYHRQAVRLHHLQLLHKACFLHVPVQLELRLAL